MSLLRNVCVRRIILAKRASSSGASAIKDDEHILPIYHKDSKYMWGSDGKIVPKLPKGTKVGKLVMGDYGLYDPKIRAYQKIHHGEDLDINNPIQPGWKTGTRTDLKYGASDRWVIRMFTCMAGLALFNFVNTACAFMFDRPLFDIYPWNIYDWEKNMRKDMAGYVPKDEERYT